MPAAPQAPLPPIPRLSDHGEQIIELEFADGTRTRIHGTAVLGRMPEATARNAGAQAIVVPDDTKSVSRAHAMIEFHGQAVVISDAGSANGSAVERNGTKITLTGDQRFSLSGGDRIWLGQTSLVMRITRRRAGQ